MIIVEPIMNLEVQQQKPVRHSAQHNQSEKLVGLKRSFSNYNEKDIYKFTKEEEKILQQITENFQKQLKKNNCDKESTKLLLCPICLEGYNQQEKCPKVLKCGHTLCLKCLQKQFKNLQCPICRDQLSNEPLLKIPSNYQILEELAYYESSQVTKSFNLHCETHPDQEIVFYDKKSYKLFCNKCFTFQKKATFSVIQAGLTPVHELYSKLHNFWKYSAKQCLNNLTRIQYKKCPIILGCKKAKIQAVKNVLDQQQEIINKLNEIVAIRINQIDWQTKDFIEKYSIYKSKRAKTYQQDFNAMQEIDFPIGTLLENQSKRLFNTYCSGMKFLRFNDLYFYYTSFQDYSKIKETGNLCFDLISVQYREIQRFKICQQQNANAIRHFIK
ncbi:hypothetical protein FGO68_gene7498 [Halteria grandinella]|uniref:RING-type domain-containing protein n=1 Tax=Halteria grandinella TaxID=5974 RepID=A0A8J8P5W4_HALGN|nr:hypothetical protein FGO68_gene7498 [Halteria grandinella]